VVVQGPFRAPEGAKGHAAVLAVTQQVTKAVEEMVRAHPDHWYWLHRRWKTRPEK
jgi:lauroyl/myristoyl acyltransferase